jgi:hypothetical protein
MPSDIKEITTDAQMDEDGQISHCMNVAPSLFKANILIIVGFNLWGGTATVKPGDEAIFGSPNFDHKFFKRGGIILVDPAQLEEFQKERSRLVSWLNGVGQTFLVPGMRIFKKSEAHEVFQKVRECRIKFEELAEKFLANYDSIVLARTQQFDVDHPEHVGRLNRLAELNVTAQLINLCGTTVVQSAWKRRQPLSVHGWIYGIADGIIKDLGLSARGPGDLPAPGDRRLFPG